MSVEDTRAPGSVPSSGGPPFIREFEATLPVHAQFVLWGNRHDSFLVREPGGARPRLLSLPDLLWETLRASGYACLLVHDPVDGLRVHLPATATAEETERAEAAAARLLPRLPRPGALPSLEALRTLMAELARPALRIRAALAIDDASRIARGPTEMEPNERDFFRFCARLSRIAVPVGAPEGRTTPLYNPVIWLADREGDLPAWLTSGNDQIRSIGLPVPDLGDRQTTARLLMKLFGVTDLDSDARAAEACEAFAARTDGLTLQAMIEVTRLARDRGLTMTELPDAIRLYKLGVMDNPWKREYLRKRITDGQHSIPRRVVGQPQAVTKTLDILKRAALGLSGAQQSRSSDRPRGVLFFAGPTGVGKTELAKAVSSLVFADESAYLRFDMSEFSAEHAGDRLIGAPPGYVGHEAGGELTDAVRRQPFRVILFDEIEKAHPRILDKFLQILEDGRLTDGRGSTVHFSESVLVFTSNLGMSVEDDGGRLVPHVHPGMPYGEIEERVKAAISDHFTRVLGRPELLNRFGDNIVVFDFIGPEAAARIFDLQLDNIVSRVHEEQGIALEVAPEAREALRERCTGNPHTGGRGIGTALESQFVNPLARALFDRDPAAGAHVRVTGLRREGDIVSVELA
ncbi:ClpA/ClpB-like protein [Streptomyces sp. PanSC19]|uniref:AAA family ATPase n=1 Tax=Streptomyces sp. PanSC19 TaxID=1520455 RepID=UPI000F496089|nr:AAA family ATPase [Streptomyces sp. PanSC19]ROQ34865.1 ClpA/ClpB-like protein [Streptomyces sp. PanSC19]